ncbi:carbohydrate kinase family protein [Coprobacter tertius]|uniref:Carbohydrate kinase n=1 Tax=Coprobacter tertius TaxID=2944915 RepID=A0ABT1MD99_9BACT|nr:carbohydrate kinase [Coprobacter tertius]MCP9610612.1 carbohydrate kinase [Coprobacter tertius]
MRKIIGIGETILDIIFKNNQPTKALPGGSVFNAMVSLGRLQIPVNFISELGQDYVGEIALSFMRENNISTDYIDIFCDGKSPVSLAFLNDENDARYMFYTQYPTQRLNVVWPRIDADDILILGSFYAVNPALRSRIVEFLDYARTRKAIIYYDPNFRKSHSHEAMKVMPSILENLEYADIVRGSDEDFETLFHQNDSNKIYKDHIKFYCPNFIHTHGQRGVDMFVPAGNRHFDAREAKVISTIGAGDNFNAGILYGLLKNNVTLDQLYDLSIDIWTQIINCALDFSTEVCTSYDNYISLTFAKRLLEENR